MSAIDRVKQQNRGVSASAVANVLDFELRKQLRDSLTKAGVYTDVLVKYDGRRGHLNITVRGPYISRQQSAVVHYAEKGNLTLQIHIVTQGNNQTTYRVTTLDTITKAAPAAPAVKVRQQAGSTLGRAIQKEEVKAQPAVQTPVYLGGVFVGNASPSLTKSIRQMVEAENKPKFEDVLVVDLQTSKKVKVTVPFDVAQAVKAQVPSFSVAGWSIKSTDGITILKQLSASGQQVGMWVIA